MQRRNVWLATALLNSRVRNNAGEDLGKIEDIRLMPKAARSGTLLFLLGASGWQRSATTYT